MLGFRGFGQGALAAGGPVPSVGYLKEFGNPSVESTMGNENAYVCNKDLLVHCDRWLCSEVWQSSLIRNYAFRYIVFFLHIPMLLI